MHGDSLLPASSRARRRAGLAVAGLVLASCLVTAPARAGRVETARERLDSLVRQIERREAALAEQHRRLDELAQPLAEVQAALQATQAKLAGIRRRLADTTARHQALTDQLESVSRTAYEQGPLVEVEALLGATSLADLVDRFAYLDSLQRANATVANDVANHSARLEKVQRELDRLSSKQAGQAIQLQSQQAALRAALLDQQRQLAELNAERAEAARLVRRLSLPPDPQITGAGLTFGSWAALFLSRIDAPQCRDNLVVVVAWQVAEGTAAAHNPLATTHDMPGSTDFNSVGVQNFPTVEAGLEATVATLRNGATTYGYGAILDALARCASVRTTAEAINASAWCRGCAGGLYVLNVLPLVESDYALFAGRAGS